MTEQTPWRVTRDDSEDLGFALSCLTSGAVTLEEFRGWIYLVLEQSEEFPDYLIDLTDVEQKHELNRRWRDVVGFWPSLELSPSEEKALLGIAYARFEKFRDDTIRRGAAADALKESPELRERFARSFPAISIPDDGRAAGAGAQDRRVSAWWLSDAEGRALTISEVQTLFINRMAAGHLTTILNSDTGMTLHLLTNRQRVMVALVGPGDAAGHAIDDEAAGHSGGYVLENGQEDEYPDRDTVPIPTALALIGYFLSHGTAPQDGWQIDTP